MTIKYNSSQFLRTCIQISLTGFTIIAIIILSLIPLYIKDQSVEIPARSPAVYLLYNVTFHVTMLSTSGLRTVPSSSNVSAFTLSTLLDIQNQLNKNFPAIQATCIITAATYKSDVSDLILNLKVSFYNPCPASTNTCTKKQLELVNNTLLQLKSFTTNGQCYSSCLSTPYNCSFVATITGPPSAFTVVGPNNIQGLGGDACSITTVTSTSVVNSSGRPGTTALPSGRRIRRRRTRLLFEWYPGGQ